MASLVLAHLGPPCSRSLAHPPALRKEANTETNEGGVEGGEPGQEPGGPESPQAVAQPPGLSGAPVRRRGIGMSLREA